MKIAQETIDRFWDKVDIRNNNECWNFIGLYDKKLKTRGYNSVRVDDDNMSSAHRVAYTISKGEIPKDLHVLHKCNNAICVNPNHLYTGTQADNGLDYSEHYWKDKDIDKPKPKTKIFNNSIKYLYDLGFTIAEIVYFSRLSERTVYRRLNLRPLKGWQIWAMKQRRKEVIL